MRRCFLAWALVFGVVGGLSLALNIAAAHALEHCKPGDKDCPCDKADCGGVANCLSHGMQIGGVTNSLTLLGARAALRPPAPHDADRASIDQRPGLDPPQS